jgi:hypothetical protein|tara:strand:+ start:4481 stop:5059 length:579 start_codon:yes stop_codon:yes gene_type:complete
MTISLINIGNIVNDGLGDDLRTAFQKVNTNFSTLETELTITATNQGANGVNVFRQKTGANLEFRKLVAGTKMQLDQGEEAIVVSSTAPDAFTRIDTDAGSMYANVHQQITFEGTSAPLSENGVKDIEVTSVGSTIKFKTIIPVTEYLTTYDFGPVGSGLFENAIQLALQGSNIDFGTLTYASGINLDVGGLS